MVRLLILAVLVVSCRAGLLPYNYGYDPYPSTVNEVQSTKSFYFFSAPEEELPSVSTNRITSNAKKHLQVVVIKAPEYNEYTNAVADLARQAIQTKTVVYVLSKEPDLSGLDKTFKEIHSTIQRPEVRFIKYRTSDDAKYAEQAIRSQYDNYSGSSSTINGATAPVLDYTSSINIDDDDELFTAKQPPFLPTGVDVVPGSSYLPPKRD